MEGSISVTKTNVNVTANSNILNVANMHTSIASSVQLATYSSATLTTGYLAQTHNMSIIIITVYVF